jgi:Leucine-rich repeat (LRR) protein
MNNQLTSLDVSQNTALTELDCNDNQLTSLNVSQNTALTYLDCSDNQLTSLGCKSKYCFNFCFVVIINSPA